MACPRLVIMIDAIVLPDNFTARAEPVRRLSEWNSIKSLIGSVGAPVINCRQ